jgi:aryl-alcohol dehydrogenase-like predicted oxidoreductase
VTFVFPAVDRERAWACIDFMRQIGEARGGSVARVALAWLLSKPHVMSVIIGARTAQQLEDNLAAADLQLSDEDIAQLDRVSALPPEYPGWMVERQARNRIPQPFLAK